MNKKLIISKTAMFIFVMAFVVIFKSIFGNENTLIGVTTITAMLMLLERDLTLNPIKNTFKFIGLNLFIGIATIIASSNMWLAIPVNFISLFLISYHLCHSLRRPMYLPFSLQYLFLLVNPVSGDRVIIRLISLVVGAIFIMLLQVLFNKNRFSKDGNKILKNICDSLLSGIAEIKDDNKSRNINITKLISSFRNMIHDKREEDYYLTEEGQIKLNLSAALEEIAIHLNSVKYKESLDEVLTDLYYFIENTRAYLDKNELLIDFEMDSKKLIEKYQKLNESNLEVLEILNDIVDLSDIILDLTRLDKKSYNFINKIEDIPNEFKSSVLNFKVLKKNSLKFSYAIRVATGITIGAFIMDILNLQEGRWIIFTILSLTNPLYELSQKKSKDRIFATILGSILIVILFDIFKDTTIRTLIIMLAGYIGSYISEYKYNMILVTVS
ncbi:FUSC family protein, partial [Clostridium sp.]|uniref:FUSC family protein n=1 Tax=Clostridium sp. TaxID=1506 RepID=UPI003F33A01E